VPTTAATPAGGPVGSGDLCDAFTAELATAALGGPVDEPQSGEVVPRPNGIYCHYDLTGDANTNVEAQLKEMTRDEFEALAETMDATIPVTGVGEAAFRRDSSSLGGGGSTVVAWSGGQGVTVVVNLEGGDQAVVNQATEAIAQAILSASP
jgi:hypothetical protein